MFCYYNKDYTHYNTICEPFLNKRITKMISVYNQLEQQKILIVDQKSVD